MFVRPAKDRAVRDPVTRVMLAAEGDEKPLNAFWARRLRDKDVEECEPPKPEPEMQAEAEVEPAHAPDQEH